MTDRAFELQRHVAFFQHMLKATGRGEFLEAMLFMQKMVKELDELEEALRAPPTTKVDISHHVRAEAERVADLVSGKSRGSKSPWSL